MVSTGGTLIESKENSSVPAEELWRAVLGLLQTQITRTAFETWLKPTEGIFYQNGQLTVAVPTAWFVEWLERRMYQSIEKALTKVLGTATTIRFQVKAGSKIGDSPVPSLTPTEPAQNLNITISK